MRPPSEVTKLVIARLREVAGDFEGLWTIGGFAETFAAELAWPQPGQLHTDPHHLVLTEHHRLLVAELRRATRHGDVPAGQNLDDLADALVGFYLGRRLNGASIDGWVDAAIATIIGTQHRGNGPA